MRFLVTPASHVLALAASSVVALLAVSGCGGDDGASSAPPPAETTQTHAHTTTEEEHEEPIVVSLYFLRDGQVGLARRLAGAEGRNIGAAAVEQLLAGPSAADRSAGLTTAIPAGTRLDGLAIEEGVARVELSRPLGEAATAQVVYTVTQFPSVRRVELEGEQHVRADFEAETPPILVELPAPGDEVSSPLDLSGTANTFEATFQAEVVDEGGRVVGKRFVTATSGSGTRGTYSAKLPFTVDSGGPGKLVVYELSAEDGSRIHETEIPLELIP